MKIHAFIAALTSALIITTPCYAQTSQLRGSFKTPETHYETQFSDQVATQLAKRAFLLRELKFVTKDAAANTNYRVLIDAAIGRENRSTQEDLEKAINELGKTSPAQSRLFQSYFKLQSVSSVEIRKDPTLQHILDEYDSKNWKDRYLSRLLMSVLSLKRRDITQGLETANAALKDVPEDIAGQKRYEYLYDIYTVINTGFILDKNMERALGSSAHVLDLAEKANLKPDAFNISNNLAALYSNRNQIKTATKILKTGTPYLQSANDQQRVIYNYTLGTLLVKDNKFREAEPFLRSALAHNPPKLYTAAILVGLARTASEGGSLIEAKTLLTEIEIIGAEGLTSPQLNQAILSLKSTIAEKEGDFEKAYRLNRQWSASRISVLNEEVFANRQESANKISVTTQLAEQRLQGLENESELKDTIIEREQRLVIFLVIIAILMLALLSGSLVGFLLQSRANKNLKAARDDAVAGEKAKSAFLSMMSHEVRTPLNAIIPLSAHLMSTTENKTDRNLLGLIKTSGETLLLMMENILHLTKNEEIDAELFCPINIEDLTNSAAKPFQRAIEDKSLSLNTTSERPELNLVSHKRYVSLILGNIISNAVKFTPEGSIEIIYAGTDQEMEIIVRDTGIGFDTTNLSELLKPFMQEDTSIRRAIDGAGIGLATTTRLLNKIGGALHVESFEGQGTTVKVTLPTNIERRLAKAA